MSRVIKKCLYLREVYKEFIVSYLPVQKQTSRSKCGPFAIVFSAKIFDGKFLNEGSFPVDTGCKLNVHKTFRRRPGHLLNVLCTFNLRPVSTGFQRHKNERTFGFIFGKRASLGILKSLIISETNIISRNSLNSVFDVLFFRFLYELFFNNLRFVSAFFGFLLFIDNLESLQFWLISILSFVQTG